MAPWGASGQIRLNPGAAGGAAKSAPSDDQPMSMGFTPKDFQRRFNGLAEKHGTEFRIQNTTLARSTPTADQWTVQFTSKIVLVAMVNRDDGTIRSFMYASSGDGTFESGAAQMVVIMTLIRAIDPALSDRTANKIAMGAFDAFKKPQGVETVQNGIRYGSIYVKDYALIIAINPAI